ncbi:MAG: methyltransferase domain-containing protein [Sedimentisphaerales bacterium]|nr:methyltransferase domain-containing protein [Sedimentisphaerales bacterium]
MKLPKFKYVYADDFVLHRMRGKSVLHLGCAGGEKPSSCYHIEISEIANTIWGIDINSAGLNKVKEWLPEDSNRVKYFHGNVENIHELNINRKFEVIFIGSIIEHLSNPGLMLSGIADLLTSDGIVIIVTPHSFGLLQFLRVLLFRNESVITEHTCWFSVSVLTELCSRYNLIPIEWHTGYVYRSPSLKVSFTRAIGVPFF